MTPRTICNDCERVMAKYARGLCKMCHERRTRTGTLSEIPKQGNGGRRALGRRIHDYDTAVVERLLSGDWHLTATPPERAEVCRRWVASGRSLYRLAQLTGWRPDRYYRHKDAA